ncbi:unnamed protein product [Rhizophagus irregularis]|nr:unnamed protein product [Rhizophagus irregularis]CAB5365641.1 unnamed protein product [Rhizophagus irregularis]
MKFILSPEPNKIRLVSYLASRNRQIEESPKLNIPTKSPFQKFSLINIVRHTFEKVVTSFAYRYFLEVEGRDLAFINHEIDLPDRLHKWFLDVKVTLFLDKRLVQYSTEILVLELSQSPNSNGINLHLEIWINMVCDVLFIVISIIYLRNETKNTNVHCHLNLL